MKTLKLSFVQNKRHTESAGVPRLKFAYDRHATYSTAIPAAYKAQNQPALKGSKPHHPQNHPAAIYNSECVTKKKSALFPNTINIPLSTLTADSGISNNGPNTTRHVPMFQRRYTSDGGYLTMLKNEMSDCVGGGCMRDGLMLPKPPCRRSGMNTAIIETPSTYILSKKLKLSWVEEDLKCYRAE